MENQYVCPACNSHKLVARYEAKYVYSYIIDSDNPGRLNTDEFYPFLYDKRDQVESKQYVECMACGTHYPCTFTTDNTGVNSEVLRQAVQQHTHS